MSDAESRLAEDRRNRQAARGLFDTRLGRVKADLAARPVPERVKAKAVDEAAKAIDKGLEIAGQSKGVIAATIGALALWAFRKPLVQAAQDWFGQGSVQDQDDNAAPDSEMEPDA
ncbi:MAG: hypothetical protein J0L50_01845 [Sphingomonadales bacterium]|nr:hypothetical protein [Sphingomonadales bacterium]